MRTPQELAQWATRKYAASFGSWAELDDFGESQVFAFPLKPPTQAQALVDMDAVVAWVAAWSHPVGRGVDVLRVQRQWPALGRQRLPSRVVVHGVSSLAGLAGRLRHWRGLVGNAVRLRTEFGGDASSALSTTASRLADLGADDLNRLIGAVRWFVDNPDSGLLIREVPVPGADTKWLERHKGLVKPFVLALTSRNDLGLRKDPRRFRVRILDEAIPFDGRDVTMSADEWAQQDVKAQVVIVSENLQPLLRLPPSPGVVGVHGQGIGVTELAKVGWIGAARVLYWGDLDTHGFNMLRLARRQWPQTESVLMDVETLKRFWDAGVPEPDPFRGEIDYLTAPETQALALLRQHDWRLEQEQIPWEVASGAIQAALGV
ncbi:MAG: DUF2220 family protein [Propionibacteriaceae bacterium]|nr:DUF2220 family protein [Propionibacteriaceae bacterium]